MQAAVADLHTAQTFGYPGRIWIRQPESLALCDEGGFEINLIGTCKIVRIQQLEMV